MHVTISIYLPDLTAKNIYLDILLIKKEQFQANIILYHQYLSQFHLKNYSFASITIIINAI